MNFGQALERLKQGKKVAREGWNGKGMWIVMLRGSNHKVTHGDYQVNTIIFDGECLPWIGIKTADNCFLPWVASQSDMLAEDWQEV